MAHGLLHDRRGDADFSAWQDSLAHLRETLVACRMSGMPFADAWLLAVAASFETLNPRDAAALTKSAWARAYDGQPPKRRELAVSSLLNAADVELEPDSAHAPVLIA